MLSVKDAETIIFNHVRPLNQEHDLEVVDLLTAFHRILATPVISSLDFPHWDNSAMDGFAVRYEDVQNSNSENSTSENEEINVIKPRKYKKSNISKRMKLA